MLKNATTYFTVSGKIILSLYWKDTGAIMYAIQLMATYLGLKSCPLGTLASDSFNQLFEESTLLSGGGILVGK